MGVFSWLVTTVAPLFLVSSPVTSYADQIYSMHKSRSSAGFSLDIPLIMLVASILKIFYWFGERYDNALFLQAILMIGVQTTLLYFALLHRPPPVTPATLKPFSELGTASSRRRPFHFWQWNEPQPYWNFLLYYTLALAVLQIIPGPTPGYVALQGYVALSVEALLPIPQLASNYRNQSCKGFRLSVLANWLIGDALKMSFFFLADSDIPWAFKLCGLFQATCDVGLGVQYALYGEGRPTVHEETGKDLRR